MLIGLFVGGSIIFIFSLLIFTVYKETNELVIDGIILRKMYEAIHDRYYFVIELNNEEIYPEYCEYTCSKEEWSQFEQDDKISCKIYFHMQETLIKSIKKDD